MSTSSPKSGSRRAIPTVLICGLPVGVLDYDTAVDCIFTWAREGGSVRAVEAANTHVAALTRHDREFGAAMARFDLVCPDGMPLVWAANHALPEEKRMTDRVYGPTLMLRALDADNENGEIRHFFLGGSETTLEKLGERFSGRFVGSYSPPFGSWPEDEFERICDKIRAVNANVIWVGLGCTKQEKWIADNKDDLPPGVYLGVGAAFAFHAGEVPQAPHFLQRIGMEWLYRMAMEPRRLFRRYMVHNTLFIRYWLSDTIRGDDPVSGD